MEQKTLQAIFKQIVTDMAYEPNTQVNTFAVIGEAPKLRLENFGVKYDHYLEGAFWSRTWVATGADPDKLTAEFPVLFAENREAELDDIHSEEITQPWTFLLIDRIECPDCPEPESRTPEQVKRNAMTMLRRFLAELYTYELWEIDRAGTLTYEWISRGRVEHYEGEAGVTPQAMVEDLESMIQPETVKITEWGDFPDMRGYFATVRFRICVPFSGGFNYKDPAFEELGSTECPC